MIFTMSDDYLGALLEDIDGKFNTILESVSFMATAEQLTRVDERLIRVEANLEAAIRVITGHSGELKDHELRLTNIETS